MALSKNWTAIESAQGSRLNAAGSNCNSLRLQDTLNRLQTLEGFTLPR